MKHSFTVIKNENPKAKPDPATLKFGETFTDHMFLMEYTKEKGWHDGRNCALWPSFPFTGSYLPSLRTGNV